MKKPAQAITVKKVSSKDENEFLRLARASRLIHQSWVKVPLTAHAFKRYVNEMRTAEDLAFVVRRKDTGSIAGVIELQDIFMGDFKFVRGHVFRRIFSYATTVEMVFTKCFYSDFSLWYYFNCRRN